MVVAVAKIKTTISDYPKLLSVQQQMSKPEAEMRAKQRADRRRLNTKGNGFILATIPQHQVAKNTNQIPTVIGDYNPNTDKWRTNKGEKRLGNNAAPSRGEVVLDFGSFVYATPAGEPFPITKTKTKTIEPETFEIDIVVGFGGFGFV